MSTQANSPQLGAYEVLEVTFESLGLSRRQHTAKFDLGTLEQNSLAAIEHAWKHYARIVPRSVLSSSSAPLEK